MKITVDEIKELMDKMAKTGLGQVVLEDGDFKLKLSAQRENVLVTAAAPAVMGNDAPVLTVAEPAVKTANAVADEAAFAGNVIKSPIVGTYYASPSPDKAAFAEVGKQVHKGDVLFIIESMKLMNEIQSDFDGEVVKILVEDGDPVEYDQPIMVIE